jgi:hypothetical protein
MLNTVSEEDKVHGWIVGIVHLKAFVEAGNQLVGVRELHVLTLLLKVTKEYIDVVLRLPVHIKVVLH